MKEITLLLTEEEYELLDELRRGRERGFFVYEGACDDLDHGNHVLAVDDGGGFVFSESPSFPQGSPLIAAAFNGLFRAVESNDSEAKEKGSQVNEEMARPDNARPLDRWERQVREAITEQWRIEMEDHGCVADPEEARWNAFFGLFEQLTIGDLTMLAHLAFLDELDWLVEKGEVVEPKPEMDLGDFFPELPNEPK
jgi:hypothetical protein